MIKILICCGIYLSVGIVTSQYLKLIERFAVYMINK